MDETLARLWEDLLGRVGGPLTFRVILQPLVAAYLAARAGMEDGRTGLPPYAWAILTHPEHRRDLLEEGWKAVAKIFVLAIVIDAIYQLIVYRWIYPVESIIVAFLLACLPYLLVRGPAGLLSHWFARAS